MAAQKTDVKKPKSEPKKPTDETYASDMLQAYYG